MKITFEVNLYDDDGGISEECILLHIENRIILKLKDLNEMAEMIKNLQNIFHEINENYEIL